MQIIGFGREHAACVSEYGSHGAAAVAIADGSGESHVYAVHFEPGGEIGPHPAGFGQLFLVSQGEAWVSGADGVRHVVRAGHGTFIARGVVHAKGSPSGCIAIMIQIAELVTRG